MRTLADICIRRPIFAAMIILALVVVGAAAYTNLGVDRLPSVDLPTVSVRTSLPGASPEEIESQVSQVLEEVVNTVEGIDELRSISGSGSSYIIATFNLDRDIDVAAQDVRDKVATAIRRLPEDVDPPIVTKNNNEGEPILTVALSGDRSVRELTELADKVVKVQMERGKGVGEIRIVGDLERAINVWVDADRLAALGLPITAVRDAVVANNIDVPAGNVTNEQRESALRPMGRIRDPRLFNEIVIATVNGTPIKVKDVGRAEDGTKEQREVARLNGRPSVTLELLRQSGANTIETIDAAKANLDRIRPQLPAGVEMLIIRDQSRYINTALHEINIHLVLGSFLACLVVYAFMRNLRATLIAGIAIPASVISTFGMMWALDFTLNSVTMLALVLMVGIVIDDAIVVLENIFRFIEEKKMTPFEAARQGTGEIALAVLATTLSLVVIFIPVSFMSSISGRFLYQFGITAAVAVLVSLLVSFTLTPMMSARLLKRSDAGGDGHGADSRGGFYRHIDRGYEYLLRLVMRHRFITTGVALLVIASAIPIYGLVQQEYTPTDVDEAEFQVRISAPEGTSFAAMNDAMLSIEEDIRNVRGVRTVLATAGGGFLGSTNGGDVYVGIAPHDERYLSFSRLWRETLNGNPLNAFKNNYKQSDVMREIGGTLRRKYPDLRASVRNFASFNIGGGNFEVDFIIRGPELEKLSEYTEALRDQQDELGLQGIDTTLKLTKPEVRVNIDRDRAADLGVTGADVGTALRLLVGGDTEITRFLDPQTNEDYDVQLRLEEEYRQNPEDLPTLLLPRRGGGTTELRNLAELEPGTAPSRIDRYDRQRAANVRGGVAPGYALADRLVAIQAAADKLNMGPAYTTSIGGRGRELERTFVEFLIAFSLSVVFMYMILASNYESLVHPVTILLALPLSIPFALFALWLTGNTLNLYSALGILVLFGVVKKNSILQIDHMNHLRHEGYNRFDAIIQGNRDRLRPILMTTLALVGGMLPLWLGTGPGAEERRAVAVVVIGGQTMSLLLTLLVTPVVYSLLDDAGAWVKSRRKANATDADVVPLPAPHREPAGMA
ncbi:MAG TPA: efflux RND transporter permease subunit [Tepidisphaeraceae bacterium]|jgi:HAE1 family hydrophobic/amphiphilic exporter-1|nr:efflux RND transporter permease subunit [Tepidisphaeraceae bacterium]